MMIIIIRLFIGYLTQTIPFALLAILSVRSYYRWTNALTITATIVILFVLDAVFTGLCAHMYLYLANDPSLFDKCNVLFMILLIPCLIYYFVAIRTIWVQKLFIISYSLTIAMSISSLCNMIHVYLKRYFPSDNLPYAPAYLALIAVMTALILPVSYMFLKSSYLPVSEHIDYKLHRNLAVFAGFLFLVLMMNLSFIDYSNMAESFQKMEMTFYAILSIPLIYFLIFRILYHCFQSDQLELILHHTINQIKYRDEQYKHLRSHIETSRRFQHDMRHSFHILQDYLNNGKVEEAQDYLNSYADSINEISFKTYCNNDIVNALLRYYEQSCKSNNIAFRYKIDISDELQGIENIDLAVILGNLLDNALDAASVTADKPHVRLNIYTINNSVVITVDNSFNGQVRYDNGHFVTTKEGHTGLGILSMEQLAAKYNGTIGLTYDNEEFHSSVVLYR